MDKQGFLVVLDGGAMAGVAMLVEDPRLRFRRIGGEGRPRRAGPHPFTVVGHLRENRTLLPACVVGQNRLGDEI
jgi:hypothetical protein